MQFKKHLFVARLFIQAVRDKKVCAKFGPKYRPSDANQHNVDVFVQF